MIQKVIAWWRGLPLFGKIISAVFVGIILVLLVVVSIFAKRGLASESKVVDTAVDLHDKHHAERIKNLEALDEEGRDRVDKADKALRDLNGQGQDATDKREERDEELRDADSWSDLDDELGEARNRGRTGSR